MLKWK